MVISTAAARRSAVSALAPRFAALACLALSLAAPRVAAAHPLDIGYLRITGYGDAVTAVLDVHVNAAARLAGVDPPAMTAAAVAGRAAVLADATLRG
ncbi:MAG TPA: hypothetical protein VK601_15110, partial [Kofleriaceae bacterium]|nr:hypothetical protein [Kofleriaceae bacterium]